MSIFDFAKFKVFEENNSSDSRPDVGEQKDEPKFNSWGEPEYSKYPHSNYLSKVIVIAVIFGFLAGGAAGLLIQNFKINPEGQIVQNQTDNFSNQTQQENAVVQVVKNSMPAVVSIMITKEVRVSSNDFFDLFPFFSDNARTERRTVGGGTGFFITSDGLVATNRHVVEDDAAEYTVVTNSGETYQATVLAKDPVQDFAILKVQPKDGAQFLVLELGNSDSIQPGQTAIAIGNALAEFNNTISVGIISGLNRTITASGQGRAETLSDLIQTDAAINRGNSGGPLLNLKGQVIGINTATATDAQSLGFAIPINLAKRAVEQVKANGKIVYPFLGVRYVMVTDQVKNERNLPVSDGALVVRGENGEPALSSGSAAAKAGLKEGDIILEINGTKLLMQNPLQKEILKYNPGEKINLKILRSEQEQNIEVELGERS